MGMSASQARYIQLTARMSDLELEGQQINQQRLNLANQSSAIQEEALKIPVPTAPSTYDYMKDVYKGKDGNGQDVKAGSPDANGNIPVSTYSAKGIDTMAAIDGGSTTATDRIDEKPAPERQSNTIKATFTPEKKLKGYNYENANHTEEERNNALKERDQAKQTATSAYETHHNNPPKESDYKNTDGTTDTSAYNTAKGEWQTEDTQLENAKNDAVNKYNAVNNATAFDYYELDEGKTEEVSVTDGNGQVTANYHPHGIDNANGEGQKIEYSFKNALDKETKGDADALKNASTGYSATQIKEMINGNPKYYIDKEGNNALSESNFDAATGKLNEGVKLYQVDQSHENIGGNAAYDLDEAKGSDVPWKDKAVVKENVEKLIQYIKNYEANNGKTDGLADTTQLSKWRITWDGETLHAFKLDGNKAQEYKHDNIEKGWTTQNATSANFNSNGVSNATLADGSQVTLTKSQELDTDAYKAAEAEYTNQKAQYDHAQEEANTKVKKLQQIDKQLELKLKRLDTERNALNTEIDAVKKVIQDNTDKSFKTFSG